MALTSNLNIVANVARVKLFALAFGTAGVGLLGMLQAVMGTATMAAGLGMDGIAVRELAVARSQSDQEYVARIRAALTRGAMLLGALGALAVIVLAPVISRAVELPESVNLIRFSAIGVLAGVVAANFKALINGFEQITALARASIISAIVTFALTAAAILFDATLATAVATIAAPVALLGSHAFFLRRLPASAAQPLPTAVRTVGHLATVASWFTLAGLLPFAVQLGSRAIINRHLGLDAVGLYQACWTLSATYVGVLLSSVSTSLLPRLSGLQGKKSEVTAAVNEQARIYLTLFAPVFGVMLVAAPLLLRLLYSKDFSVAADLLRWQMLGDVFKIPVWTLATSIAAARLGRIYLAIEALWVVVYLGALMIVVRTSSDWWLIGACFAAAYVVQFIALTVLGARLLGFRWEASILRSMGLIGVTSACALRLPSAPWAWAVIGALVLATLADVAWNARRVLALRHA